MRGTILFIVVVLLNCNVEAQSRINRSILTPIEELFKPDYTRSSEFEGVDLSAAIGSPYEQKEFKKGELIDLSFDKKIVGMSFRYNVYNDQIEIKEHPKSEDISAVIKSDQVFVRIGNKEYHYKEYTDAYGEPKKGYLIKLRCNADINVYKELTKTFKLPKRAQTSYHKNEPAKFLDTEKYYMEIDGKLVHVKMNKRKIAKAFPDKQPELKKYIIKEGLDFKKEVDLVRLVAYYDTL
ncbi:hypothetical protein [Aquimarina sp. SS2-1]|uniref:hypothetical protein n=1 Tax=Aquimarina besae TaxID=3342247 RepID=UPI00366E61F5